MPCLATAAATRTQITPAPLHDTYCVVAHVHYMVSFVVLIALLGGLLWLAGRTATPPPRAAIKVAIVLCAIGVVGALSKPLTAIALFETLRSQTAVPSWLNWAVLAQHGADILLTVGVALVLILCAVAFGRALLRRFRSR